MTFRDGSVVTEEQPSLLERWGTFLFKYRDAVFPAVILAIIIATRPRFPSGSRTADLWLNLAGILVAVAGQALRITVIGFRYIVRGGKNRKVHAEDLVTEGIFALSRNPLYVGNILVLFGLFIIWNSPLLYLIGVPFVLIGYMGIVAAEEAFLRKKFGPAYDAYCQTTNRLIPDFRKAPQALRGIPFNWRRVLVREYGSWTAWIGTAGVLIIAESLYYSSYAEEATLIHSILGVLTVVFIALAITRLLKLNKMIRA